MFTNQTRPFYKFATLIQISHQRGAITRKKKSQFIKKRMHTREREITLCTRKVTELRIARENARSKLHIKICAGYICEARGFSRAREVNDLRDILGAFNIFNFKI